MQDPDPTVPPVGTEILFQESGHARRGWIVCTQPVEVGVYPLQGEESESRGWPLDEMQVLDAEPQEGWEALRLEGESGGSAIEIRLHHTFMDGLRQDAQRSGKSLEEIVGMYLQAALLDAFPKA